MTSSQSRKTEDEIQRYYNAPKGDKKNSWCHYRNINVINHSLGNTFKIIHTSVINYNNTLIDFGFLVFTYFVLDPLPWKRSKRLKRRRRGHNKRHK